jgi:hypothetical protein
VRSSSTHGLPKAPCHTHHSCGEFKSVTPIFKPHAQKRVSASVWVVHSQHKISTAICCGLHSNGLRIRSERAQREELAAAGAAAAAAHAAWRGVAQQ